jgi:putative transposase
VTVDAGNSHKEISKKITEKSADYVFALKRNHENMYDDVKFHFESESIKKSVVSENKGHGREEKREYYLETDINWLDGKDEWSNLNDSTKAIELMRHIIRKGVRVLADRGYDSAKILAYIQYCCATACIPPRKNKTYPQKYSKEAYKNRNQIERFFQRLKNFRRVATRYDKLPSSFLSFVHIASICLLVPKFAKIV